LQVRTAVSVASTSPSPAADGERVARDGNKVGHKLAKLAEQGRVVRDERRGSRWTWALVATMP